jgi:hypothetical protein
MDRKDTTEKEAFETALAFYALSIRRGQTNWRIQSATLYNDEFGIGARFEEGRGWVTTSIYQGDPFHNMPNSTLWMCLDRARSEMVKQMKRTLARKQHLDKVLSVELSR